MWLIVMIPVYDQMHGAMVKIFVSIEDNIYEPRLPGWPDRFHAFEMHHA